ncbi:hypothetical protein P2318_22700 [Myxococcaceae bacterium GXIMD 01537]
MAGILSTLVVSGLLAATPDVFTFDGPEVTARTTSPTGFFIQGATPAESQTERGSGSAVLTVRDRITEPLATYGDAARLDARFRIAGTDYTVELTSAGFPPVQALEGVSGPIPRRLPWPVGGGVRLDVDLNGGSGIGFPAATRVHAAAAVWGVGRVTRNGQVLTDTALIHAAALSAGARSDDDTHGMLPIARPGDLELSVLAWNLPRSQEPRGFIEFGFDDVSIERDGAFFPAVAVYPNTAGPEGVAVASSGPFGISGALGLAVAPAPKTVLGEAVTAGVVPAALEPVDSFLGPGRVAVTTAQPVADATIAISQTPTGQPLAVPGATDPFDNSARVTIALPPDTVTTQAGVIVSPTGTVPLPTDPFFGSGRVALSTEMAPATVGGLAPVTQTPIATTGNFSVVALGPAVPGAPFGFGTTVDNLVVSRALPLPGTVPGQTPVVPLVATPAPLNAQVPVPLVADSVPLNAQTPVPLVSTPTPLGVQPLAGPAATTAAPIVTTTPAPTVTVTPVPTVTAPVPAP